MLCVAPALVDAVIAYLDDGNAWAAERLAHEPGWVLDAAMRESGEKTFAAYLDSANSHAIAELRLGRTTEQLYAEAETLHRQLERWDAGGPVHRGRRRPGVRRRRADRVRARPADRRRPFTCRELVKGAIKRTHDELQTKANAAAQEK